MVEPTEALPAEFESIEAEPWGAEAIAWWNAMGGAAAEGPEHMVNFLDSDFSWQDRVSVEIIDSVGTWVQEQTDRYGGTYPWIDAGFLTSADEVLGNYVVPVGPRGIMVPFLDRMEISPEGVSHWVTAGSLEACRDDQAFLCEVDAEALVDRYLALWSESSDVAADSVYADEAVVADSLLGASTRGLDAIERSVGSGSWPDIGTMVVPPLADGRSRAIFVAPSEWSLPAEIRFLVDVDDGTGCPGRMGMALELQGDQIVRERRFHDVSAVRRCADPAVLQAGWWETMATPSTLGIQRVDTLSYGEQRVEVFRSMAWTVDRSLGHPSGMVLDRFIGWGLDRFDAAGLPPPNAASVTFMSANVFCQDLAGRTITTEQGASITLCLTPATICSSDCEHYSVRAQRTWLHELAHAWLSEHTDQTTRAKFLELVRLARWSDPGDAWSERGVERAAETIAYSLMEAAVNLTPTLHGTCDDRDFGFRILTSRDPIVPCLAADAYELR